LLFQCFPVSGHHLSDGISEALFLLLLAMALWRGVVAVRSYKAREFAWCGFWGGLAYLTRPEGALVVLAAGLVLVGLQTAARRRRSWAAFFACGLSLSAAAGGTGGIYVWATGHLTNKPAAGTIGKSLISARAMETPPLARGYLVASSLGVFFPRTDYFPARLGRSLGAMGAEFSQGFHYFGWVPAVFALFWGRSRFRRDPGFWIVGGYCLLHGVILLLLAMVEFYVSDRHVMVLILCGSFFTVAGLRECALRVSARIQGRQTTPPARFWPSPGRLPGLLVIAMVLVCLPKTVQRLHGNRAGNHLAGLWLAPRLTRGDVVIDDHAYSHYYASQVFAEGSEPALPKGYQPTCYVVVTRSKDSESEGSRKDKEDEIRRHAKLVYQWPENRQSEEARVVIYSQPRSMDKNPWTVAP
jgi:hypothetical protein